MHEIPVLKGNAPFPLSVLGLIHSYNEYPLSSEINSERSIRSRSLKYAKPASG